MTDVTLADARAQLGRMVERASQGEPVRNTRRGKPVARLTGLELVAKLIDLPGLRALTEAMPRLAEPASSWLRSVRDESRY